MQAQYTKYKSIKTLTKLALVSPFKDQTPCVINYSYTSNHPPSSIQAGAKRVVTVSGFLPVLALPIQAIIIKIILYTRLCAKCWTFSNEQQQSLHSGGRDKQIKKYRNKEMSCGDENYEKNEAATIYRVVGATEQSLWCKGAGCVLRFFGRRGDLQRNDHQG
jgi:hypothetical protein